MENKKDSVGNDEGALVYTNYNHQEKEQICSF